MNESPPEAGAITADRWIVTDYDQSYGDKARKAIATCMSPLHGDFVSGLASGSFFASERDIRQKRESFPEGALFGGRMVMRQSHDADPIIVALYSLTLNNRGLQPNGIELTAFVDHLFFPKSIDGDHPVPKLVFDDLTHRATAWATNVRTPITLGLLLTRTAFGSEIRKQKFTVAQTGLSFREYRDKPVTLYTRTFGPQTS